MHPSQTSNDSPVKLNAFIGNSLYPGDPGLTAGRLSPCAMGTPPPPHLSKSMSAHVAMVNPAYYGNEHHQLRRDDEKCGGGGKMVTVRGTVEFEGREQRHNDMNI